jgi:hypothetical protein
LVLFCDADALGRASVGDAIVRVLDGAADALLDVTADAAGWDDDDGAGDD